MKRFQDFLDSLSTRGGSILMLFISLGLLIGFVVHITHDEARDASIMAAAHDMMIGFGGALLGSLSGGSSRQQMVDRAQTANAGSIVARADSVKVETVSVNTDNTTNS